MQKIIIKNFGAIVDAEIEIKKILVLIGDNATGKSTIIKLISTFLWIEKKLFRGSDPKRLESEDELIISFLRYHRIESFLKDNSVIEYYGKIFIIKYCNNKISIENQADNGYLLPQIMYVPAERNFLTYLRTTKDLQSGGALQDFEREFINAANNLQSASLSLPFRDFEIEYNQQEKLMYLINKEHKIKMMEAASGFQSSAPLYLVSYYLSKLIQNNGNNETMTSGDIREFEKEVDNILKNKDLTEQQKQIAISTLSKKFNKKAFINIVEEPEQNLFPVSQMQLTKSLVSICNQNEDNKLLISTHSPYVLATINNLILAHKVGKKFPNETSSKVDKQLWLNYSDVFAAIVKNGTVEELIDKDFEMIEVEQLDAVSRIINEEFDYLYEYETAGND